jgi:hypothetical protein
MMTVTGIGPAFAPSLGGLPARRFGSSRAFVALRGFQGLLALWSVERRGKKRVPHGNPTGVAMTNAESGDAAAGPTAWRMVERAKIHGYEEIQLNFLRRGPLY